MVTEKDSDSTTTSYNSPVLPPLYFAENDEKNSKKCFIIEPLPSEALNHILSFLDWGDFARLSCTNSSFQSIMHDAATLSDQKWDLAMSLLNGTNGLQVNPKLAMKYLHDLAGITISKDTFDPSYDGIMSHSNDINSSSDSVRIAMGHSIMAMKKIALSYLEGNGVEVDLTSGLAWLKAAHCHGDIEAAYEVAIIYEYSKYGVPVDIYHAAKWFLGAATAGHVESMAEYAMCLELGCGVDQSDDEALEWYTKAANRGHITSNFSVGEMFEEARGGLPQSDSEAVLWYYKAALMGCEDSKNALRRLSDIARIVVPGWATTLNA